MELLLWIVGAYLVYRIFIKKKNPQPIVYKDKSSSSQLKKTSYRSNSSSEGAQYSSGKSSQDDIDGLATFTISYGPEEEESTNSSKGRWVGSNESISIQGQILSSGNFYFGGQLRAYASEFHYLSNQETEASLIDDSLPIVPMPHTYQDESLAYWPKFNSISPKCRGAYLNWLCSERNTPDTPIGYVFIYFYGIERRVLVDGKNSNVTDQEYLLLYNELKRLRAIYSNSRSFRNYCSRLIEVMSMARPNTISPPDDQELPDSPLLFKIQLAKTVANGEPIPPTLALTWLIFNPEYNLRTPARRCTEEFAELFKLQYASKFAEGIIVKPNKTKLKLEYLPASNTIRGVELEQLDLPDPSILKTPLKKLVSIADSCTSILEPYSRYLGKKDTTKNDISALLLLPSELVNASTSKVISTFQKWAEDCIQDNDGLVSIEDFWRHTGSPLPSKMNKKEIDLIQNLANRAGYGIAPDSRYHNAKPTLGSYIVLFSGGHGEYFEPSKHFNDIAMILRLGAMVAAIDSHIADDEVSFLKQQITYSVSLSPSEKSSLSAYLTWQLNCPQRMTGLKAKLEALSGEQKGIISRILISVALVDGKIETSEIKHLEKLYTQLGLDKSAVTSDIHNHTTSKPKPQVTVNTTHRSSLLDKATLAAHESETKDVQNMLGAIFVDNEPVEPEMSIENEGLDSHHIELYQFLVSKEKWARVDITEQCQKLGLLVDGAIETINDWSFDMVDAPVLDDNDDIYVDLDVVAELKG